MLILDMVMFLVTTLWLYQELILMLVLQLLVLMVLIVLLILLLLLKLTAQLELDLSLLLLIILLKLLLDIVRLFLETISYMCWNGVILDLGELIPHQLIMIWFMFLEGWLCMLIRIHLFWKGLLLKEELLSFLIKKLLLFRLGSLPLMEVSLLLELKNILTLIFWSLSCMVITMASSNLYSVTRVLVVVTVSFQCTVFLELQPGPLWQQQ